MSSMKLQMKSASLTRQNILRLGELFPGCVVEAKDDKGEIYLAVDFERLRQELSDNLVEGERERYHLDWPGKRESLLLANAPIAKTLRPLRDESVDFDTTKNLFLEGDNLDALKLIQENYLGKVKMIYIDPPYNTGNDFIYEDDFSEDANSYLLRSNQKDENENRLVENKEANGRFHSDWLSMLYSRLRLARNLLSQDGFIIVSIDDVEMGNLCNMLNDIFGEANKLAVLCWDRNRKNDAKFFSVGHEYMHIYAKNKLHLSEKGTVLREPKQGIEEAQKLFHDLRKQHNDDWKLIKEKWRSFYRNISSDDSRKQIGRYSKVGPRGPYRDDGNISWPGSGGPRYKVLHPKTGKPCKIPDGGWRYSKPERFWEEVEAGKVVFGPDETTLPRQCRYLFEGEGQVMPSVFYSYAQTAAMEFSELMAGRVFDNPKNWRDIQRLVQYLTGKKDIILDFFAGSSTTAHSVMAQNAIDGGERRFIMVQLDEKTAEKSAAFQAGFKNIAEISRERIRRAGKKIMEGDCHLNWNRDVGFRLLKIDTTNMKDVFYHPNEFAQQTLDGMVDNVKADRSGEDLLFQVLADWGVDLSLPIARETLCSKTVFIVGEDVAAPDLIACFDADIGEDLMKLLAERHPLRVVFLDNGFATDSVKINAQQIFKQFSSTTEFKTV